MGKEQLTENDNKASPPHSFFFLNKGLNLYELETDPF